MPFAYTVQLNEQVQALVDLFPVRFTGFSTIFNRLVELWSKYKCSALALAQRKGSAKV